MRKLFLFAISLIPVNFLKIFLYNFLFGYKITYDSQVGFCNLIDVKQCLIKSATIGHFNKIHANVLYMENGSVINRFNRIANANELRMKERAELRRRNYVGGAHKDVPSDKNIQNLHIGIGSAVIENNYLDISCGSIIIGDNVVTGGFNTQFWTHGFDIYRNLIAGNIILGDNIYVGSSCMFLQGIKVTNNVSIGAGTIVHRSIHESGFYTSANLIKRSDLKPQPLM